MKPILTPYYEDGAVTIYHGKAEAILPLLEPVDHAITDPPYARDVYVRMDALNSHAATGALGRGGLRPSGTPKSALRGSGTDIAKMAAGDIGAIDEILEDIAGQCGRLTKRWALVFSDAETTWRWRAALIAGGLRYVRTGAWVKHDPMPQMSGDRPGVGFEPCTIAHAQGAMRWNGGGHAAVWTHGTTKINRPDHPCPKPLPLMSELITLFTDPGDLILDPFGGSGTTAVAAKRLGRRCILIEKEEKYCEIAANRLRQGALALFSDQVAG